MQGIEAAKRLYEDFGAPMLEREFPAESARIAAGLAGHGSECFFFDDEISRDHDFTPGFALWITQEDDDAFGFRLARAYAELLKEHGPVSSAGSSALGEAEHGVCVIGDFYTRHIGIPGAPRHWREWLNIPEYAFAEAVNGSVFRDDSGIFSGIRETILHGMPEDVRKKKLAARAAVMAQSGQYNFLRCLKHGERGAACLALAEFVRNAGSMIFLLNRRFAPYYKWMFRAMRSLPRLGTMAEPLEFLLAESAPDSVKAEIAESVCAGVAEELRDQGLSGSGETYLEPHAFEIMKRIRDREIRELHVMEG